MSISTLPSVNLTKASDEWRKRPDDERFLSLAELKQSVLQRKAESWTAETTPGKLQIQVENEKISTRLYSRTLGREIELAPTHFAFGELAKYAQAPGAYLRTLPAELAAINLQWGLEHNPVRDNVLVLGRSNGEHKLRAMTSTSYGRIWDAQVVQAVERVNHDNRWQIPAASYAASNPKRATTLYASDRDVFIFLCDPNTAIEVNGSTLYRGFYTWNSEVGAQVFGLTTFLYNRICDNRIIWGASNIQELRIRHTGGAPDRFAYEGARYLKRYAEESTYAITEQINRAQQFELPASDRTADDKTEGWGKWLKGKGFTDALAKNTVAAAQAEEGQARSLWDIVQGVTAHARSIPHTDERVKVEALAGKLMQTVGNK